MGSALISIRVEIGFVDEYGMRVGLEGGKGGGEEIKRRGNKGGWRRGVGNGGVGTRVERGG